MEDVLWIFPFVSVCLPVVNSTLQLAIALVMKFTIFSDILNIFIYSIFHICDIKLCALLSSIHAMTTFSLFIFTCFSVLSALQEITKKCGRNTASIRTEIQYPFESHRLFLELLKS